MSYRLHTPICITRRSRETAMLTHIVLIQPNLRFFHELFGWEVELAREEEAIIKQRRQEMEATGMVDEEALKQLEEGKRRIVYAWPTFCRDLVSFFWEIFPATLGCMIWCRRFWQSNRADQCSISSIGASCAIEGEKPHRQITSSLLTITRAKGCHSTCFPPNPQIRSAPRGREPTCVPRNISVIVRYDSILHHQVVFALALK